MTKLKSGPHLCADKLLMISPTQHVTTKWLRQGFESQITMAAASNQIYLLKKAGALVPAGRGRYIPRPDKIAAYYTNVKFNPAQKKTVAAVAASAFEGGKQDDDTPGRKDMFTNKKKEPASVHPDIDVINSLLDAIAAAEPVLQKYKRMCEAAHS